MGHAVLRSLQLGPLAVRTVGLDPSAMSAGLYWTDAAYLVPRASDEAAYIERLLEICRAEHVDALIPGSDPELIPLARHQDLFLEQGTRVIVGGLAAVELVRDKGALAGFCRRRGLPFVETWSLAEAREMLERGALPDLPVIAKPRSGSGSVGTRLIYDPEDLLKVPAEADFIVQRYLPPVPVGLYAEMAWHQAGTSPAADPIARWSQRLDQTNQIGSVVLAGKGGEILGNCSMAVRLKDGVPMELVPDPSQRTARDGLALAEALIAEGMRGPFQLAGRMTPEGTVFFEVNARFVGAAGARAALGYRMVAAALWAFVLDREDEARRCLAHPSGAVAMRHVEETIVPVERIEAVRAASPAAAPRAPRRVLVTGAAGYVGASLVARLLASPGVEEVRALVRSEEGATRLLAALADGKTDTSGLTVVPADLAAGAPSLAGLDAVVHLAALRPAVRPSAPPSADELFLANAELTRRLVEAVREAGVPRLVHVSSMAVYGHAYAPPWSEALVPHPGSTYGLSKWAGEMLCQGILGGATGVVILRPARIYGMGPLLRWGEMPHKFARLAAAGSPLPVSAGGDQRIDLLHVRDLCGAIVRACALAAPREQPLVFNVGSGQMVSIAEVARLCVEAAVELGLPPPPIEHTGGTAQAPLDLGVDSRRIRARTGWAPAVGLREGLSELIAAARG